MAVTALYAGLLAILLVVLSIRVIAVRRAEKIAVGDHGNDGLLRRMRAHANFTEYVPMVLLAMALAESMQAPRLLLHAIGAVLLAGRIVHAVGISRMPEPLALRVAGMAATFTALIAAAAACVVLAARSL